MNRATKAKKVGAIQPPVSRWTRGKTGKPIPQAYLDLLGRFLLRPFTNDKDLAQATVLMFEMAVREKSLLTEEQHYFDVLCGLIELYNKESMPDVGAADMLRFLMEQNGVSQIALATATGIANSTLTSVLDNRKDLTPKHLVKLAAYFHVEPSVFLPGND